MQYKLALLEKLLLFDDLSTCICKLVYIYYNINQY